MRRCRRRREPGSWYMKGCSTYSPAVNQKHQGINGVLNLPSLRHYSLSSFVADGAGTFTKANSVLKFNVVSYPTCQLRLSTKICPRKSHETSAMSNPACGFPSYTHSTISPGSIGGIDTLLASLDGAAKKAKQQVKYSKCQCSKKGRFEARDGKTWHKAA
jgi:hypothetical protein